MKRSEMILAGGFLVVVVGYFAGPPLLNLVTGSSQQLQARQTELNRELAQLKKLKRLQKENEWLRRAVLGLTLDKLILGEAARGNFQASWSSS